MPTLNPNRRRVGDPEPRRNQPLAPTPPETFDLVPFTVCVPDTPAEKAFFVGTLTHLTKWTSYQRTLDQSAKQYAEFWRGIIDPAITDFLAGNTPPCAPEPETPPEDTITDNPFQFLDGVLEHYHEGGVFSAIGYVIEEAGKIVFDTALRIVSTYVFGTELGGVVYILIDGVLSGTVSINPLDYVEIVFDTLTDLLKEVTFEFVAGVIP